LRWEEFDGSEEGTLDGTFHIKAASSLAGRNPQRISGLTVGSLRPAYTMKHIVLAGVFMKQ
jgi:hypothetical protein